MKVILFNMKFAQVNRGNAHHGGGENDFTVFSETLRKIGNTSGWKLYALIDLKRPLVRELQPFQAKYQNFSLITDRELDLLKQTTVFYSIYSSNIRGLKWLIDKGFHSRYSMIVIYGMRFCELKAQFSDLFLACGLFEKICAVSRFFGRPLLNKIIVRKHQNLFKKAPEEVQIIATSQDTYNKLLEMHPKLILQRFRVLYASPKTLDCSIIEDFQDKKILKKYGLESGKYFLLISLGRVEKNVYFALKQLRYLYKTQALSFKTFVCGERKKNFLIEPFKGHPDFIVSGYIPGEELRVLYKHAFLFIYPTRSEGFGMPILEAMEHATPVLCSDLSALIEVGGQAAEYFELNNIEEFRTKLLKFYFDSHFYRLKREQSRRRYQEMSALQIRDLQRKVECLI